MITDQPCTETDYFGEPPESRRHVSFTNLVYDPTRWQHERDDAYTELQLPQEPDDFCARLQRGHWFSMMGTVLPFEIITYTI